MKHKQIFVAFLACIGLVVLWFSFNSSYKVYQWVTQTKSTKPLKIEWDIEQQASDRYMIVAAYTFKDKGKEVFGQTEFHSKKYKSIETAKHFIDEYSHNNWVIWYSPSQPQNSTINRFFPLKSCLYTAIVWCIFLYFIWLSYYVGKNYQ